MKIFFSVTVICTALLLACQPSKEGLRKQLVMQCRAQGDSSGITGEMKTIYAKFCDCMAEQTTASMSSADFKVMEKLKKEGKEAEAMQRLQPFVQPCIEAWQQESEAAANAQNQMQDSVGKQ